MRIAIKRRVTELFSEILKDFFHRLISVSNLPLISRSNAESVHPPCPLEWRPSLAKLIKLTCFQHGINKRFVKPELRKLLTDSRAGH